mmetsp:Transcript_38582/g.70151  ORF Transcript_38582/g.70151 Transcript_38582/m.70151 type:complete len:82 (+) Transcript_38582:121-366(+)
MPTRRTHAYAPTVPRGTTTGPLPNEVRGTPTIPVDPGGTTLFIQDVGVAARGCRPLTCMTPPIPLPPGAGAGLLPRIPVVL